MDSTISLKSLGAHNSILFKITSECNDFCQFCLEYKFIKAKRSELSFSEFRENYLYLKRRAFIDYSVLTGGEPTLHPDFFKMLQFLRGLGDPFRLITNLIKFNDKDFLSNLKAIFGVFENQEQKRLSKIIASINDLPEKSTIAKKRFLGLRNALENGLPLLVTVIIYQDNLIDLPRLADYLKNIIREKSKKDFIQIEFRSMYFEGVLPELLKVSLPRNFNIVRENIEKSIEILNVPGIKFTLWNFPLCYLDNYEKVMDKNMGERQQRRIIKISKDFQLRNAEIRNWEVFLKSNKQCQGCKLNKFCGGIDENYLKRGIYPPLKFF